MMATQENVKSFTDPAQVEANRRGEITATQKVRFKKEPTLSVGLSMLAFIAIISLVSLVCGLIFEPAFRSPILAVAWLIIAGGILGLAQFQHQRGKARIEKDLADNIIQTTEGELVFRRGSYAMQLPGRRVGVGRGRGGLLPGVPYRFYILPQTGYVLSAEPLAPRDKTHVNESVLKILAQANDFDLNSLEANRQGRLSAWQMFSRLPALLPGLPLVLVAGFESFRVYQIQFASYPEPAMRPRFLIEAFILAAIMPIFLVLGGIWAARKGKFFETNNEARPMSRPARAWLLVCGGFFVLASYLCARLYQIQSSGYPEGGWLSLQLDSAIFGAIAVFLFILVYIWIVRTTLIELWQRRVASVEGIGRGRSVTETHTSTDKEGRTTTHTSTTYYYYIGQESFEVSERAYNALLDSRRYRLYYLPHSRKLLNIEPLSASADTSERASAPVKESRERVPAS